MSKKLTISNAAKEIGISIETIRYYERTGLISQPKKPLSGYRTYNNEAISKLYFIKRAKLLGFSLNEISEIIKLGAGSCEETKELATQKLENIKMKIDALQAISKTLEELIEACEANTQYKGCPIISAISKK
jgi:MerR family mercuric resistance operon transcriptional regulator